MLPMSGFRSVLYFLYESRRKSVWLSTTSDLGMKDRYVRRDGDLGFRPLASSLSVNARNRSIASTANSRRKQLENSLRVIELLWMTTLGLKLLPRRLVPKRGHAQHLCSTNDVQRLKWQDTPAQNSSKQVDEGHLR